MKKSSLKNSEKISSAAGGCLCNCSSYEEHLKKIKKVQRTKFVKAYRITMNHGL